MCISFSHSAVRTNIVMMIILKLDLGAQITNRVVTIRKHSSICRFGVFVLLKGVVSLWMCVPLFMSSVSILNMRLR